MTIHLYTPEHRRQYRNWLSSRTPAGQTIAEMDGGPRYRWEMLLEAYHFAHQLHQVQRIANADRAELEALRDRVLGAGERGDA